jgi:dipeptidyl aminopeptidase/acylaminoacyl peptidase
MDMTLKCSTRRIGGAGMCKISLPLRITWPGWDGWTANNDPARNYACGVCDYGDADLFNSWALTEKSTRLYTEMQLGHPARKRPVYEKGSLIRYAKEIQSPLLLTHGLEDPVVPPESSEEIVHFLRKEGKSFEYKTYSGESHGYLLRRTLIDYYPRVEQFLDWYLLPDLDQDRG